MRRLTKKVAGKMKIKKDYGPDVYEHGQIKY